MSRQITDTDRQARHAAGQRKIRRRCTCGRVITGNAAWWSHTHHPNGEPRDGHGYAGSRRHA